MKIFIISGEKSGEQHGAALSRAIFKAVPNARIQAWGGENMSKAGVDVKYNIDHLGYIGLWEVLMHLPDIRKQFKICKKQILEHAPDAVICIDYPGFNMRMMRWCFEQKIPVYFYISPQVWAWKYKRIFKLQKYARRVFCILPFEPRFYEKYGVNNALYVGHPLMHSIDMEGNNNTIQDRPTIALLPGSRIAELKKMVPLFTQIARKSDHLTFVVAGISKINADQYKALTVLNNVSILWDKAHQVVKNADAAIITSGTATLETALLGCPQVVTYKVHPITYALGKRLTSIKFFSLVNLILGEKVVQERLQKECNAEQLIKDIHELLGHTNQKKIEKGYKQLRTTLTDLNPSERITKILIDEL